MKAVERNDANGEKITYKGEREEAGRTVLEGVGDLVCYRPKRGVIFSFWKPSEEELELLKEGGAIAIGLYGEPIPPISVNAIPPEPEIPKPSTNGAGGG